MRGEVGNLILVQLRKTRGEIAGMLKFDGLTVIWTTLAGCAHGTGERVEALEATARG